MQADKPEAVGQGVIYQMGSIPARHLPWRILKRGLACATAVTRLDRSDRQKFNRSLIRGTRGRGSAQPVLQGYSAPLEGSQSPRRKAVAVLTKGSARSPKTGPWPPLDGTEGSGF